MKNGHPQLTIGVTSKHEDDINPFASAFSPALIHIIYIYIITEGGQEIYISIKVVMEVINEVLKVTQT